MRADEFYTTDVLRVMREEVANGDYDGFWHLYWSEGGRDKIAELKGEDVAYNIDLLTKDFASNRAAQKALEYIDSV